jgi:hypothetical protein
MPNYRVYLRDGAGHILKAIFIDRVDDSDAMEAAGHLERGESSIEVWLGVRQVGSISPLARVGNRLRIIPHGRHDATSPDILDGPPGRT